MKYMFLIGKILRALDENNPFEVQLHASEICNLIMDKNPITEADSEMAFALMDELQYLYKENNVDYGDFAD